ncbi:MAG TPA: M28 family peptidase [bacterium]|nr:M28 family peptidase [bacterium]
MCINKKYNILILVAFACIAIFSIVFLFLTSNNLSIQNYNTELEFNGDNAYNYVQDQLDIGFRIPGTEERKESAQYFISKFLEIDSNFTYIIHNFTVYTTECQNILFKANEEYDNVIILGAHYDSRAKATRDPISENRSKPVPGANDGASGAAVLIELARVLYGQKDNLSSEIWFLFFDAEDQGGNGILGWDWIEGSEQFVNDLDDFYDSATENIESMILLDMVGGTNLQFINEQYSTSSLLEELFAIGRNLGYTNEFPSNPVSRSIIDDHIGFLDLGIPSADLIINFWDNPSWPYHHTTEDDISHISNYSLEVTGRTIEQFVYNNYITDTNYNYQGNRPWDVDMSIPDMQIIILLGLIFGFAGVAIIITLSIKKFVKKKEVNV